MRNKFSVIFTVILSVFLLSACGESKIESPESVLEHAQKAISQIESLDASLSAKINISKDKDNMNLNVDSDFKANEKDKSAYINLKLSGDLTAADKKMNGDLALKLISLDKNFYFILDSLNYSDPSIENYKALLDGYMGVWQHLPSDMIPDKIKELQDKDETNLAMEKEMKDLFAETKLFNVQQEYGIESINGVKTYHYNLSLNTDATIDFIKKSVEIQKKYLKEGEELADITDEDIESIKNFIKSIDKLEVWIGLDDYFPYKVALDISASDLVESGDANTSGDTNANTNVVLSIEYLVNTYNKELNISVPENYNEFNPLSFMAGANKDKAALSDNTVEENTATEQGGSDNTSLDNTATEE